jgi:hypothetical protein
VDKIKRAIATENCERRPFKSKSAIVEEDVNHRRPDNRARDCESECDEAENRNLRHGGIAISDVAGGGACLSRCIDLFSTS